MMFPLDEEQETAHALVTLMWPHETQERRGLALAEEVGEACRAILKRSHALDGDGDRNTERDWTENLRKELSQVLIVTLSMIHEEGWKASEMIMSEVEALDQRRVKMGLN